jgi:putative Holliday junction resolvase
MEAIRVGPRAVDEVVAHVREIEAIEVIIGLPLSLDGTRGPAALKAQEWSQLLRESLAGAGLTVPVRLVDERFTTVQAQRGLRSAGESVRSSRTRIDSAAATVLLQSYLDSQRPDDRSRSESSQDEEAPR